MTILNSIHVQIILHYIILTNYCTWHIQVTSNHSNVNVEITPPPKSEWNDNIKVNTIINYTTLYYTYLLLLCKRQTHETSSHSNLYVEINKKQ